MSLVGGFLMVVVIEPVAVLGPDELPLLSCFLLLLAVFQLEY
jgi:hypothetical protein